jgi:hypothetical protein
MGEWGFVVAGYGLTAAALTGYVVSLRRQARRLASARRAAADEERP